jgi:hypothetical protein
MLSPAAPLPRYVTKKMLYYIFGENHRARCSGKLFNSHFTDEVINELGYNDRDAFNKVRRFDAPTSRRIIELFNLTPESFDHL